MITAEQLRTVPDSIVQSKEKALGKGRNRGWIARARGLEELAAWLTPYSGPPFDHLDLCAFHAAVAIFEIKDAIDAEVEALRGRK